MSTHSKVIARTHTQTDSTKTLPLPHTREVNIGNIENDECIKVHLLVAETFSLKGNFYENRYT